MPLRREHQQYYRRRWRNFRLQLIAAAGGKICSNCGQEHPLINGAHQDHDPQNDASVELMCPSCHAAHDAGHRIAIMRRRRAEATGQMWLMPEMEWAPFASWEIPGWVYDRLNQLPLFSDD